MMAVVNTKGTNELSDWTQPRVRDHSQNCQVEIKIEKKESNACNTTWEFESNYVRLCWENIKKKNKEM